MEPQDQEKVIWTTRLDQMERKLVERLEYNVRNGYSDAAEKWGRILVNIAMYRRLKAGMKGTYPPGGGKQ